MSATFLYTLLLGIIYLVKKNWNATPVRWSSDLFREGNKRLHREIHREANSRVVMKSVEDNTALKEVVVELA